MPTYTQRCQVCSHEFDDVRRMADAGNNPPCEKCGEATEQVLRPCGVSGLETTATNDDRLTRQHFGLKKGERVHRNFMSGEELRFDRLTSDAKAQEAIRQSYIKAGLKQAEDPGSVKLVR